MGCVEGQGLGACEPGLPRFILLGSFSGTLLPVSILEIVYDCNLSAVLQSWRDAPLRLWRGLLAVSKVECFARAPCHLGFILLGGFSGALRVVSILGVIYDCHC